MRLYTCDKEFENDTHIKAWLLRVVVNLSKNHLRDNRRIVLTELTETIPAPDGTGQQDVLDAVLALPEKYRAPIHLHYYEDTIFDTGGEDADYFTHTKNNPLRLRHFCYFMCPL